MSIYFLRHGKSQANLDKVFAGQKNDSPITDIGINQVKIASNELSGIRIDRIYASRLKRARQTADIVAEAIGFDKNKIEYDDRIQEYDMGSFTNTPICMINADELVPVNGVEDPVAFRDRVFSFIKDHQSSNENILMVSHDGVSRIIEATKLGLKPNQFFSLPSQPNAQVVKLDLSWLE
jgi:probable phosphoglycerate mutase